MYIWTQDSPDQEFHYRPLGPNFPDVVWRVSWSVTGNVLAVSSGDKVRALLLVLVQRVPYASFSCISCPGGAA